MPSEPVLSPAQRAFIDAARRAVLATIGNDGRPRLVPVCFCLDPDRPTLYSPLDDKPKRSGDPLTLARVRDVRADPRVTVLVDRWDEDWTRLAWLRADGTAEVLLPQANVPDRTAIVSALRARYPQYADQRLEERPLIRIMIKRVTDWGLSGD
jgi:PPOX class probable F420-dependent enzyme